MSMQDPIADMLVRIKNAQAVRGETVSMPLSKMKKALAEVLKNEGYVAKVGTEKNEDGKPQLVISLKYHRGIPVIQSLKRASRSGLRTYKGRNDLPEVMNGLGASIISTSKGLMTDKQARELGLGGEVICYVS